MKASSTLCLCLFCCRCFLKSTSTCCCLSTSSAWASWLCLTPWGKATRRCMWSRWIRVIALMFAVVLFLSLSPLMSRIFPDSFPNKQFQLLFTQGSGESKEGETFCPTHHWKTLFTKQLKKHLIHQMIPLCLKGWFTLFTKQHISSQTCNAAVSKLSGS